MSTFQVFPFLLVLFLSICLHASGEKPETYLQATKKLKEKKEKENLQTTNSNHNLFTYLSRKQSNDQNSQSTISTPENNYFVLGKPAYGGAVVGPSPVYVPPSPHREEHKPEIPTSSPEPKPVPIPLLLAPPQYQGQHPQFLPVLFAPAVKGKPIFHHGLAPNMVPIVLAPTANKIAEPQFAPIPQGLQIFLPPHAFPPKLGDFPFEQKQRGLEESYHPSPIPFAAIPVPYRGHTNAANPSVVALPLQFIPGSHYRGGAFISPKVQIPTGKPDKPVMVIPYARHIAPPTTPNYFQQPKFKPPVIYDDDFDLTF